MILIVLSLLSFLSFVAEAIPVPTYLYHVCPNTTSNKDTAYQANLNLFLADLPREAYLKDKYSVGFYNATAGNDPDKLYALFLCRGDVNADTCQSCVNVATTNLTKLCPTGEQSIIWYDECLFRYSNQSFFSIMSQSPGVYVWSTQNFTGSTDIFGEKLRSLFTEATAEAVNTSKMFATRKVNLDALRTLYGLVQCTLDLSKFDCNSCLEIAFSGLRTSQEGSWALFPSCIVRYELYPFYNEAQPPAPTPPPPVPIPSKGKKTIWIAMGGTGSAIIVLLLGSFLLWRRQKRDKEEKSTNDHEVQLLRLGEGSVGGDYSYDIL